MERESFIAMNEQRVERGEDAVRESPQFNRRVSQAAESG